MEKRWSYEELLVAVKSSISIAQVLVKLGLKPQGSNYKTMHRYFAKYNIDTTHLLGKAHLKGQTRPNLKKPIKEFLVKDDTVSVKTESLKKRLIKEQLLDYSCSICMISSWLDRELVLHLDHINGDAFDNRIENLRLLCPNCHSQTDTYCGKKNRLPRKQCTDCSIELELLSSIRCRGCEDKSRIGKATKIKWPTTEQLIKMVESTNYSIVGKGLGVSANAVKKHIHNATK
jgi:hypothetical protein